LGIVVTTREAAFFIVTLAVPEVTDPEKLPFATDKHVEPKHQLPAVNIPPVVERRPLPEIAVWPKAGRPTISKSNQRKILMHPPKLLNVNLIY
jgi:hypothetical protein